LSSARISLGLGIVRIEPEAFRQIELGRFRLRCGCVMKAYGSCYHSVAAGKTTVARIGSSDHGE
jgi:hypothetical protein